MTENITNELTKERWYIYAVVDALKFQLLKHGLEPQVQMEITYPEFELSVKNWGIELKRQFVIEDDDGWKRLTDPNNQITISLIDGIAEEYRQTYNPMYPDLTP